MKYKIERIANKAIVITNTHTDKELGIRLTAGPDSQDFAGYARAMTDAVKLSMEKDGAALEEIKDIQRKLWSPL